MITVHSHHVPTLALFAALALPGLSARALAQETVRWHGVEIDLPKGWSQQLSEEILLLAPAGWKAGEATGEAYGLLFDDETRSLDAEDLDETIDGAAEEIVAGLQRADAPKVGKVGALDARTYRYSGANGEGKEVVMTIHVFAGKDGCVAMFLMGFTDKLASREKELAALLGSVRLQGQKKARRAFGLGKTPPSEGAPGAEPAAKDDAPTGEGDQSEAPPRPEFVRIPGARELAWSGVLVDVPKDWQVQPGDDGAQLLLPPGFGESGVLDEIYALCGDGSLRSLEGGDVLTKLQAALDEIQPGLAPKGAATVAKFGALRGKRFVFAGRAADGQPVEARVFAFPTGDGVRALLGLGFPKKLADREATVDKVLQSLRPAPAAKPGAVPAELAGQWVFYVGTRANDGGGSSRQKVLTLRADGTYSYVAEHVSTNPEGAAWGDRNDSGRWSADATTITFRSQSGGTVSFRLQKRNHPKNRDPMLVIDGEEFVTATQRAPW